MNQFKLLNVSTPRWVKDAFQRLADIYDTESEASGIREAFVFDPEDLRHIATIDLIKRTIHIDPDPIEDEPYYWGGIHSLILTLVS